MKIIFVIPNLSSGGAERVISILANSFVNLGISVDVVLMKDRQISYTISDKVSIVCFDQDLLSCSKKLSFEILRAYFKAQKHSYNRVVAIPFLDTCLKRTLLATVGLHIPVIASERNDPHQKGGSKIARMKANIPYLLASHCVFQTSSAAEYYYRSIQKKSDVIMNPLVMSKDIHWKGTGSTRIVSVGRLESQKNQLMLLEAFSHVHEKHPEYTLEIYGEGSMREVLLAKIDELQLCNVIFLRGHSSNIPKELEESFLFALSSDYEGLSNALIEALAVGMPVVTTDHPCGGAKALVQNGINGILVPTGDAAAMAAAMLLAIENPEFALHLGENAYQVRQLLSAEQIAEKWLTIIQKL